MKIQRRLLIMAGMLCAHQAVSVAQITITGTDVGTFLQVGATISQVKDTLTSSLNIGAPGSTSWDFSGLLTHTTTALVSVSVASTPFASLVPTATHALKTSIHGPYPGVPGTVDADVYLYYALGGVLERIATLAGGTLHVTTPFVFDFPAELHDLYIPRDTTYALPLANGTSWTSVYTDTTIIFIGGGRFQTTFAGHSLSYTVDAFGPMKMPGGAVHDALRIRRVDSSPPGYLSYIFVAKNGASVTVTATDVGQPNNGVIQIAPTSTTWNLPAGGLPVQLSYFRAVRETGGPSVTLTWATASETNSFGFEVERRQGSTGDFVTLAGSFVPGAGTSIVPHTYSFVDPSVAPGLWYYRLRQIDLDGNVRISEPQSITITTGIDFSSVPITTSLAQNYPNPFNNSSRIAYALASAGHVRLTVLDLLGREVAQLVDENKASGSFSAQWDAGGAASGTYVVRMTFQPADGGGAQSFLRRVVLLK